MRRARPSNLTPLSVTQGLPAAATGPSLRSPGDARPRVTGRRPRARGEARPCVAAGGVNALERGEPEQDDALDVLPRRGQVAVEPIELGEPVAPLDHPVLFEDDV